jgi:hypothetical protein
MSRPTSHRICLTSWELLEVFQGSVIPREGEVLMLDREGQEQKFRVSSVMYKTAATGELLATVFVNPV